MAKTNGKGKGAAALTAYVVLELVHMGTDHTPAWRPVFNQTAEQGADGQPRVFLAAGKTQAIRQHTGDGEDVVEGTWKAVPLSSWKGGEITKRVTASERLPIDEALA